MICRYIDQMPPVKEVSWYWRNFSRGMLSHRESLVAFLLEVAEGILGAPREWRPMQVSFATNRLRPGERRGLIEYFEGLIDFLWCRNATTITYRFMTIIRSATLLKVAASRDQRSSSLRTRSKSNLNMLERSHRSIQSW
jgi:hypothetical protein